MVEHRIADSHRTPLDGGSRRLVTESSFLGQDEGMMLCPDNHRCENYSVCVENPNDEGSYFCDCDASLLSNEQKFAGLYCEHEATTYCSAMDLTTYHSFCTNGGKCKKKVAADESHKGCHCQPGYVGTHCQFIEGSEVPNWMGNPSQGRVSPYEAGGKLSPGGIFGLVLLSATVVGAAILYSRGTLTFSRKKEDREGVVPDGGGDGPAVEPVSANLHLDADGGVLKEAVEEKQAAENDGMDNEEGEDGVLEDAEII